MIRAKKEIKRLRTGYHNLHERLLIKRGWAMSRKMSGDRFTDTYQKGGQKLVLKGVGAWESSSSDVQIYWSAEYTLGEGNFVQSTIGNSRDFMFKGGEAYFMGDEARMRYLRSLNDFIQFVSKISG